MRERERSGGLAREAKGEGKRRKRDRSSDRFRPLLIHVWLRPRQPNKSDPNSILPLQPKFG